MSKKRRRAKRERPGKAQHHDAPQMTPGLLAKLRKQDIPHSGIFTSDELGLERLSAHVLRLAEALGHELGHPPVNRRALVELAVLGWNLSLFPRGERSKFLREFPAQFSSQPDQRLLFTQVLRCGIRCKRRLFPEDRRFIVAYELRESRGGYALHVASQAFREDDGQEAVEPAHPVRGEPKDSGEEGFQDGSQ